jgi:Skp family chaperone for outer membrane proteins
MVRWNRSIISRVLLALVAAAAVLPSARAADQKIAVVNVSYVFQNYKKVLDVERRINAVHDTEKNSLNQRIKDLSARNKEMQQYFNNDTASVQIFDAVQKLRKDTFLYQRDLDRLNAEIQKSYTKEMREVLSDIRVAIRAVADKDRFDLVLRSPDDDDPEVKGDAGAEKQDDRTYLEATEPKTVAQMVARFNRNPVLFGAKTVDITQEVLKRLNADFEKKAPGGK